jgi:hypothetical protein
VIEGVSESLKIMDHWKEESLQAAILKEASDAVGGGSKVEQFNIRFFFNRNGNSAQSHDDDKVVLV